MTNQSEQKPGEAGRKGGQQSHSGSSDKGHGTKTSGQQEQADHSSGQQHGGRPDDAGQKGGQHSQGGK